MLRIFDTRYNRLTDKVKLFGIIFSFVYNVDETTYVVETNESFYISCYFVDDFKQ